MADLEIEVTYLLDYLPEDLGEYPHEEILDKYLSITEESKLRLRKKGDTYEFTKKSQAHSGDASVYVEETIHLNEQEYSIIAQLSGKELHKIRYYYEYNELKLEIDVFEGALKGLVTAECEFPTEREKITFVKPEFCLVDITQEKFIAGSELQNATYEKIEPILNNYGYTKI
jgi:adenylate cyclase